MITNQQTYADSDAPISGRAVSDREPIAVMLQGQERIRIVAGMMSVLADDLWQRGRECYANSVLTFFLEEWPLRVADEEASLMPRLLARQGTHGPAWRLQRTLAQRHDRIREVVIDLCEGLHALTRGAIPAQPTEFVLNLLRAQELLSQHADWEEGVFFPWARQRLPQPDLAAIWREMTERRGLRHLR